MNESTLKPLCQRVDKWFRLPTDKLDRYFAVVDDEYLVDKIGEYYRGVHVATSRTDEGSRYILDRCLPPEGVTKYDTLVYIRHSTCQDPTSCVVTYAHELQHVVQELRCPKLLRANAVLRANLWEFKEKPTEIDLPSEVEANIISKRVAEEVCNDKAVEKFARKQLGLMRAANAAEQIVRWEFFLDTPSSTAYDFVQKTLELVEMYKGRMNFGMETDTPGWWEGPLQTADDAGTY